MELPLYFASKITFGKDDQCWEWKAALKENGYGVMCIQRKMKYAHRFMYEIINGDIPPKMHICHTCDNRKCVNPRHLFLGTAKENMADCISKKRNFPPPKKDWTKRTTPHHWQTMTLEQVVEIKKRIKSGEKQSEIARAMGVRYNIVNKIKTGERWWYVEAP